MNTIKLNKYFTDIQQLTKSFTVKLHMIAVQMNRELKEYGVIYDKDDITTWPYYLNIIGLPHSANTIIHFTTLETNEVVELTKANLTIYQRSHNELLTFGFMYDTLCNGYMGQELYIRGIICDITIEDCDTYDGDILYYNKNLVEENEVNLIRYLSLTNGKFIARWIQEKYIITDDLYTTLTVSKITNNLITLIYSKRLENINSNEIHSHYQDLILASNFNIVEHKELLSKQSTIWLCKNIKYIGYNLGKNKTLDKIIEKVVSASGFDVCEVVVSNTHNKEDNLVSVDMVTGFKEKIDFDNIIDSMIMEDTLNKSYSNDTYRYQHLLKKISTTFGIDEKSKVLLIKLSGFITDKEVMNAELLQKSLLHTLWNDDTSYTISTSKGNIVLTNRELFKSTILAFLHLYKINNYENLSVIESDNMFIDIDTDLSTITTKEDRRDKLEIINNTINVIMRSNITYIDKQLICKELINYEISNSNNEMLSNEIELLRKAITTTYTIDIEETLGEYELKDKLSNNNYIDTLAQVYKLFYKEFDSIARILKKLKDCISLVSKITSYTTHQLIDTSIINDICPIEQNMIIEGETIVDVTSIDIDCEGAVAGVNAFGGELVDELVIVSTSILEAVESRVLEPDLRVHQENHDRIVKLVKPRLT